MKYGDCKPYDKDKLFFNDSRIDAIYIATPNTFHAGQSINSLEHKIPVLCEKPFAMNLKETERWFTLQLKIILPY